MRTTQHPGDLRRHRRRPVFEDTLVTDMIAQRMMGYAIDLSMGGMRMFVETSLLPRVLYQVRFDLAHRGSEPVHVEAGIEIVRCQDLDRGALVGARFIHLGDWQSGLEKWLGVYARSRTSSPRHS